MEEWARWETQRKGRTWEPFVDEQRRIWALKLNTGNGVYYSYSCTTTKAHGSGWRRKYLFLGIDLADVVYISLFWRNKYSGDLPYQYHE